MQEEMYDQAFKFGTAAATTGVDIAKAFRELYLSQDVKESEGKGFQALSQEAKSKLEAQIKADAIQSILRSNHFAMLSLK